MITALLATSSLLLSPQAFDQEQSIEQYRSIDSLMNQQYSLSASERDKLFREAEFAAIKAQRSLEKAERAFWRICDMKMRDGCTAAVCGAVASLGASGSKARVIVTILSVVGKFTADGCNNFWEGYDHLQDAKRYAEHCDACQEALWRG
jgi:hypothetical protein